MFSFLFGNKTARKTNSTTRSTGFRPQCEVLEDRLVMTSLTKASFTIPSIPITKIVNPLNSLPPAQAVNLVTEPRDLIAGQLTSTGNQQLYSFQLQNGEFLQADIQTPADSNLSSLMTVFNSAGAVLKTVGASLSPATGLMTNNPAYGFAAPASGTYYVEVAGNSASAFHTGVYTLELHRIALAQGTQNVATLAQTGSMYAWLNGNTLDISGPTGYGFGISGNWTQKTTTASNGLISSTYTASGAVQIETSAGLVPMTLSTAFTVTTAGQLNGQVFGVVSGMNTTATINTGSLTSLFGNAFGFNLNSLNANATISMNLGGVAGIGLGSTTVVHNTGAPVNNAVPYLYFTVNPAGLINVLSIVCDPADPALYVEGSLLGALPIGPLSVNGFGLSQQGLIPYTPVDAPSQSTSTMNGGHLLFQGTLDTTSLTVIPSQIVGDITLNLDPNHTGKIFGGAAVTAAEVAGIFAEVGTGGGAALLGALSQTNSPLAQNFDQVFRNLSVGINGTLNVNPFAQFEPGIKAWVGKGILALPPGPNSFVDQVLNFGNSKITDTQGPAMLALGHGSMIYDGPTESLYFRGGTTNPFVGIPPLAKLTAPAYTLATQIGMIPTLDLDGAVKPGGKFFLDVAGTYNIAGLPESGQVLIADNYPVTGAAAQFLTTSSPTTTIGLPGASLKTAPLYTGIYFDANVHVLGNRLDLQGKILGNGDFTLQASAQVNLGALTGSAYFTLSDTQAFGFSFTADMNAGFSSDYLRGNVDVAFNFGVANGNVTYAGSVSVSGQVYLSSLFGWQGASLSGGIANGDLWLAADGYKVEFAL